MIECKPLGICSWDYTVTGEDVTATVSFNSFGESGSLNINGKRYSVEKKGAFDPEWTLRLGRDTIATASKESVFTRSFDIQYGSSNYSLKAISAFSREMHLKGNGRNVIYSPKHAFTRRAQIRGSWENKEVLLFGFYLAVLIWRRSANSGGAAAAG
ncbi:MAG: hypothetical protein L3J39_12105 [Verrucomicrobiales bacterium]|nr:hypothetical protein [Verrucomicrobiales bacterium]